MEPAGICVISSVLGSTLRPQQISLLRDSQWRVLCLHTLGCAAQVGAKAPELLRGCNKVQNYLQVVGALGTGWLGAAAVIPAGRAKVACNNAVILLESSAFAQPVVQMSSLLA